MKKITKKAKSHITKRRGNLFTHILVASLTFGAGVVYSAEISDMYDQVAEAVSPTQVEVTVPKFLTFNY